MSTWCPPVECTWQLEHGRGQAPAWLVSWSLGIRGARVPGRFGGGYVGAYVQSWAVVDDYGDLVPIEAPT